MKVLLFLVLICMSLTGTTQTNPSCEFGAQLIGDTLYNLKKRRMIKTPVYFLHYGIAYPVYMNRKNDTSYYVFSDRKGMKYARKVYFYKF